MSKVNETKRAKFIRGVLWVSFVLSLAASVTHLADVFASLERSNLLGYAVAIGAALAVDGGIASLSYAWGWKRKTGQSTRGTVGVLVFLMGLSIFANLSHAVGVTTGSPVDGSTLALLDMYTWIKVVLLSASLPVVAFALGELLSNDDIHTQEQAVKVERQRVRTEQAEVSNTTESGKTFAPTPEQAAHARSVKAERDAQAKARALDTLAGHLDIQPDATVSEMAGLIGRSRTTVYTYLSELERDGRIHRNGHTEVINHEQA